MEFKFKSVFFVILAFSHQVLSVPAPPPEILNDTIVKADSEKPGLLASNSYFQASEQIFYLNDCRSNVSKIRSDYDIIPNFGAYKYHLTPLTWNDARSTCVKEGGHLAVIRSPEELKYIQSKITTGSWIGLHSLFKKDEWLSVSDESLDNLGNFAIWRPNEPNNAGGNERCVEYEPSAPGGINDNSCDRILPYFCKIDIKSHCQ